MWYPFLSNDGQQGIVLESWFLDQSKGDTGKITYPSRNWNWVSSETFSIFVFWDLILNAYKKSGRGKECQFRPKQPCGVAPRIMASGATFPFCIFPEHPWQVTASLWTSTSHWENGMTVVPTSWACCSPDSAVLWMLASVILSSHLREDESQPHHVL